MIEIVLNVILDELRANIKKRFDLPDIPKVVISPLVDLEGKLAIEGDKNKLILTLVDIEETRFEGYAPKLSRSKEKQVGFVVTRPPIHLNLFLLVSAYFTPSDIIEGLKYISATISFFQSKSVFDHQNTTSLHKTNISKLVVELHNQSFQDKSHMWSMLGAKYIPSALYKIRMLSIQENETVTQVPDILKIDQQSTSS